MRRSCLLWFLAAISVFLSSCGPNSPQETRRHAITSEIVEVAQRSNRRAKVTVHQETPSFHGIPLLGFPPVDDIYISIDDPAKNRYKESSQSVALARLLADIARRHRMTIVEKSSAGTNRFDLAFHGIPTHTVRIAIPVRAHLYRGASRDGHPRLAIIIDDLGNDRSAGDAVIALPFPVTLSVLPHQRFSQDIAEQAYRHGNQVLLHLPMQAESEGVKSEAYELRVGMSAEQLPGMLTSMLATVPHAVGVNNHEGSRATSDQALMDELMPVLRERGLFFIDSRTSVSTVAYDTAERAGVAAASRKVFLDDSQAGEAIQAQLELSAEDAVRDGMAIAIGHPHPATIHTLAQNISLLQARGISLVFASELAH